MRRIRPRRSLSAISFASFIVLATATGSWCPSSSPAISIPRPSSVAGCSGDANPLYLVVCFLVRAIWLVSLHDDSSLRRTRKSTARVATRRARDSRMANATTLAARRNTAQHGANGGQSTATDAERGQILGPGFPLFAAGGLVPQSD